VYKYVMAICLKILRQYSNPVFSTTNKTVIAYVNSCKLSVNDISAIHIQTFLCNIFVERIIMGVVALRKMTTTRSLSWLTNSKTTSRLLVVDWKSPAHNYLLILAEDRLNILSKILPQFQSWRCSLTN
jgi:hypothetical protein